MWGEYHDDEPVGKIYGIGLKNVPNWIRPKKGGQRQ